MFSFTEKANIIVPYCKLHNDASCDVSQDGTLLATFAPSHRGFPDDNILAVYSLKPENLGDCLYTKSFGRNILNRLFVFYFTKLGFWFYFVDLV